MSKFELRAAEVSDAARLLEIYSYYITDTAVTFEWDVPSVKEFEQRIENVKKQYPYIVAVQDGKIIGYAYAHSFRSRAAYAWTVETSIYVDKDCRRSGAGTALLGELERQLKELNVLNVYSGVAYIEKEDEYLNHDSVKFHEKMGYKNVTHWHQCGYKFNRWYDIVFLEKMLGEHTENPKPVKGFIYHE